MQGLSVLLRHPEVATRSCESCQTWQYNEVDGPTGKAGEIARRGGHKLKRFGKTPCVTCPKKSPDQARHYELSERNLQAVEFYYITRAMNGANLSEDMKQDAIVQLNMGIIDRIVRPFEAEQASGAGVAPLLMAMAAAQKTERKRK